MNRYRALPTGRVYLGSAGDVRCPRERDLGGVRRRLVATASVNPHLRRDNVVGVYLVVRAQRIELDLSPGTRVVREIIISNLRTAVLTGCSSFIFICPNNSCISSFVGPCLVEIQLIIAVGIATTLVDRRYTWLVVRYADIGQWYISGICNHICPRDYIAYRNVRSRRIIGIVIIGILLNINRRLWAGGASCHLGTYFFRRLDRRPRGSFGPIAVQREGECHRGSDRYHDIELLASNTGCRVVAKSRCIRRGPTVSEINIAYFNTIRKFQNPMTCCRVVIRSYRIGEHGLVSAIIVGASVECDLVVGAVGLRDGKYGRILVIFRRIVVAWCRIGVILVGCAYLCDVLNCAHHRAVCLGGDLKSRAGSSANTQRAYRPDSRAVVITAGAWNAGDIVQTCG